MLKTGKIEVPGDNGEVLRYAAYGPQNGLPVGGDKLTECNYQQDIQVYSDYFKGENNENLKGDPQKVNVPKGMKSEQFDKKVIETINSFGNFMLCFIPVFAGIIAISKGVASSVAYNSALFIISQIISLITKDLLLPVTGSFLALSISGSFNESFNISGLTSAIKIIQK